MAHKRTDGLEVSRARNLMACQKHLMLSATIAWEFLMSCERCLMIYKALAWKCLLILKPLQMFFFSRVLLGVHVPNDGMLCVSAFTYFSREICFHQCCRLHSIVDHWFISSSSTFLRKRFTCRYGALGFVIVSSLPRQRPTNVSSTSDRR